MSKQFINKSLLKTLDAWNKTKKKGVNWREILDKERATVFYALPSDMLKGIPPLNELKKSSPRGEGAANLYIDSVIKYLENEGFPTYDLYSFSDHPGQRVFKIDTPGSKGVALVAPASGHSTISGRGKSKNAFESIKTVMKAAHTHATQEAAKKFPDVWQGFDVNIGHLVRPDQGGTSPVLQRSEAVKGVLAEIDPSSKIYVKSKVRMTIADVNKRIKEIENEVYDLHVKYSTKFDRDININTNHLGKLETTITVFHEEVLNKDVLNEVEKSLGKFLSQVQTGLAGSQVLDLKGSPTIRQQLRRNILATAKQGKIKREKYKSKARGQRTYKGKAKVKRKNISNRVKKIQLRKGAGLTKRKPISLFNVRNLINQTLAEAVKREMGNSTDQAIKLRNQTGRFASSVNLLTLTSYQNKLFGAYTYLRDPYDVFLPGHRLNPPSSRDPRIYAEGGIRRAAQTILRNRFPGIQLELQ